VADVVIFGAGDIARLADYYLTEDSPHQVVAFTVDRSFLSADRFLDRPLVPFDEIVLRFPPDRFEMFVALSYARMNATRAERYTAAKTLGYRLVSYVSSRCTFLTKNPIGDNCFILEDNTVQPFVTIGSNVTLWSGNHVGHDSTIGDHCFIASHVVISGHVTIGERSFIGVNATLRDSITIAPQTLVGAGALVMKNTATKGVYIGERAKRFQKSSDDIEL
jgi:sugar O-acyltransferase (sialic acid O-acetyltransferase NeuD family)